MREKGGPVQALRRLRCSGYGADERWRDHDIIAVEAVRPAGTPHASAAAKHGSPYRKIICIFLPFPAAVR